MAIRHKLLKRSKGSVFGPIYDVAGVIAAKAFEHLTKPAEMEEHMLAAVAYDSVIAACGLTPEQLTRLKQLNLVCTGPNARIDVVDGDGNSITIFTHHDKDADDADDERYIMARYNAGLECLDPELYEKAKENAARQYSLRGQREELARELVKQLDGRSTKEIMEKWPEAWPLVAKELNIKLEEQPLFVPLERLLAKYLPALPDACENLTTKHLKPKEKQ